LSFASPRAGRQRSSNAPATAGPEDRRAMPASSPPLAREGEIRALEAALSAAAAGRGSSLRIEAASGLGKTALLDVVRRLAARQLFLSSKTVETHLSSSYRKLDIASRRELGGALIGRRLVATNGGAP
jgi:hypothetical protein